MIKINILTYLEHNLFYQQLDLKRFSKHFCFYENSDMDIEWDMVVVFESVKLIKQIKCKKGGLIFIAAEPPMSSVYSDAYLNQFDILFISHPKHKKKKNLIFNQFYNDWHFGLNHKTKTRKYKFDQIKNLKIPKKNKNISVITSSQKKLPMHLKRVKYLEKLQNTFKNKIDFYGRGTNPVNDKADALLPYRFHICIENECTKDLWTEKFSDPLLAYSVPIYIGCTNMTKYFPENSFYQLNINDYEQSTDLLKKILSNPLLYYNKKLPQLLIARDLLINKYNIYPTLVDLYNGDKIKLGAPKLYKLKSMNLYFQNIFLNYKLRLKRKIYKMYFNLTQN